MIEDGYNIVVRGARGMIEFPGNAERLPNGNTLVVYGGNDTAQDCVGVMVGYERAREDTT